ncbi:uncharacterized protein LOC144113689 [Amblyomma americanum]
MGLRHRRLPSLVRHQRPGHGGPHQLHHPLQSPRMGLRHRRLPSLVRHQRPGHGGPHQLHHPLLCPRMGLRHPSVKTHPENMDDSPASSAINGLATAAPTSCTTPSYVPAWDSATDDSPASSAINGQATAAPTSCTTPSYVPAWDSATDDSPASSAINGQATAAHNSCTTPSYLPAWDSVTDDSPASSAINGQATAAPTSCTTLSNLPAWDSATDDSPASSAINGLDTAAPTSCTTPSYVPAWDSATDDSPASSAINGLATAAPTSCTTPSYVPAWDSATDDSPASSAINGLATAAPTSCTTPSYVPAWDSATDDSPASSAINGLDTAAPTSCTTPSYVPAWDSATDDSPASSAINGLATAAPTSCTTPSYVPAWDSATDDSPASSAINGQATAAPTSCTTPSYVPAWDSATDDSSASSAIIGQATAAPTSCTTPSYLPAWDPATIASSPCKARTHSVQATEATEGAEGAESKQDKTIVRKPSFAVSYYMRRNHLQQPKTPNNAGHVARLKRMVRNMLKLNKELAVALAAARTEVTKMEENDLRRAEAHQVLPQIISSMEEGSAEHGGTYGQHIRALRLLHVLLTPGAEVTLTDSNDGSEEGGPCQQENVAQGPEECGFSVEEDKKHKKDPEVPRRSTAVRDARLIHRRSSPPSACNLPAIPESYEEFSCQSLCEAQQPEADGTPRQGAQPQELQGGSLPAGLLPFSVPQQQQAGLQNSARLPHGDAGSQQAADSSSRRQQKRATSMVGLMDTDPIRRQAAGAVPMEGDPTGPASIKPRSMENEVSVPSTVGPENGHLRTAQLRRPASSDQDDTVTTTPVSSGRYLEKVPARSSAGASASAGTDETELEAAGPSAAATAGAGEIAGESSLQIKNVRNKRQGAPRRAPALEVLPDTCEQDIPLTASGRPLRQAAVGKNYKEPGGGRKTRRR